MIKQPNIPSPNGERIPDYLRILWGVLKDFSLDVWKFCDNIEKRVAALEKGSES